MEFEHVEDDEKAARDVGDSGVVMAATSDFELEVKVFGAYDCGLHVRLVRSRDYEKGFVG